MDKMIKRLSPTNRNKHSRLSETVVDIKLKPPTMDQITLANWLDEHAYTRSIESILQKDGSIRLVGEELQSLPDQILLACGPRTTALNLSENNFSDLNFLSHFINLHTLILNKNHNLNEFSLPYMSSLKALWLNNCEITNILKWIKKIKLQCPNLIVLSISNQGNNNTTNNLNVTPPQLTLKQLRLKIIRHLPNLCILDNMEITRDEIEEAFSFTENVFNRVVSKLRRSWSNQSQTTDTLINSERGSPTIMDYSET